MSLQTKVVSHAGNIFIGKEFAGKTVSVERIDDKLVVDLSGSDFDESMIPIYPKSLEEICPDIEERLQWMRDNPPVNNFEELMQKFEQRANSN